MSKLNRRAFPDLNQAKIIEHRPERPKLDNLLNVQSRHSSAASFRAIGSTTLRADCFFGLGFQRSDFGLLNATGKTALVRISRIIPGLTRVADSVFLDATKSAGEAQDAA